jgi:hypothetical protein
MQRQGTDPGKTNSPPLLTGLGFCKMQRTFGLTGQSEFLPFNDGEEFLLLIAILTAHIYMYIVSVLSFRQQHAIMNRFKGLSTKRGD